MVVPVQASLSVTSRWLTRAIAATYLLLGLIMFAVPGWSAHHFPWKVSPFVAMTIGSYCSAVPGWQASSSTHGHLPRVYALLLYLWLFGVLETVVVIIHRDKLAAGAALTVPYLITLGLAVVAALAGLADWRRRRPLLQGAAPACRAGSGRCRSFLWWPSHSSPRSSSTGRSRR
jgi:hypothetical protein